MHYGNRTETYRAASYAAFSVNESLANKCILVVPQLRFHMTFYLPQKSKAILGDIILVVTDQLKTVLIEEFQHCIQEWKHHFRWCIAA